MSPEKLVTGDVGMADDLAFVLSNLLGAEDHCAKSFYSSQDQKYIDILDIIRKIRTRWLSLLVKEGNAQSWCISKHLLSSMEGLIEVGNRFASTGQKQQSGEAFNDSGRLLKLFLMLNDIGGENNVSKSSSA